MVNTNSVAGLVRKTSLAVLLFVVSLSQLYDGVSCRSIAYLADHFNSTSDNSSAEPVNRGAAEPQKIKVAKVDFQHIATPFMVALWVILASLVKLGFHLTTRLSKIVPESCVVILLGAALGGIVRAINYEQVAELPLFDSRTFFLFILPPIVLEAGYFLHIRTFFDNVGTILLYAVVGTIFNTFTVGLTLWVTVPADRGISLLHFLLFSCLIAAVDPVAVLAVFEEIHVNEVLYILVFGESLLNDAVTVVLYRLFQALVTQESIEVGQVMTGVAAFFVVSIGGLIIGIVWAFLTAFLTRFTDHVRVLEPIFIVCMSYMAYLTAELFHFSGIISIVTCAVVMKPYVEGNISQKSRIPLKYFLKMASSLSETIVFMLLGVILFNRTLDFDVTFIFLTICFITVYRCVGVVLLTWIANSTARLNKLEKVDQFIMAYGGLRGAVAFSLATVIDEKYVPAKTMMETTAIVVVLFTVFIQGTTIKPLVDCLKVKRAIKRKEIMLGEVNDKVLDNMLGGVQDIIQHRGHYYWKNLYNHVDVHYLRRYLMRHQTQDKGVDETLVMVYKRLLYRDAMLASQKTHVPVESESDNDEYTSVVKDHRCPPGMVPYIEDNSRFQDFYQHMQLAAILGKPRKGSITTFTRNNVIDETDIGDSALRIRRHAQAPVVSRTVPRGQTRGDESEKVPSPAAKAHKPRKHGHRKHNSRHNKHKKHMKIRKKLSDIAEKSSDSESEAEISEQGTSHEGSPHMEDAEHSQNQGSPPESHELLPKLADFEPSSPTLDKRFSEEPSDAAEGTSGEETIM